MRLSQTEESAQKTEMLVGGKMVFVILKSTGSVFDTGVSHTVAVDDPALDTEASVCITSSCTGEIFPFLMILSICFHPGLLSLSFSK